MVELEAEQAHAKTNENVHSVVEVSTNDCTISTQTVNPDQKLSACNTEKMSCFMVVALSAGRDIVKEIERCPWIYMRIVMPYQST